jgi:hypothetical protein
MFTKSSDPEEGDFFQMEAEFEDSFIYDPSIYEYVQRRGKEYEKVIREARNSN